MRGVRYRSRRTAFLNPYAGILAALNVVAFSVRVNAHMFESQCRSQAMELSSSSKWHLPGYKEQETASLGLARAVLIRGGKQDAAVSQNREDSRIHQVAQLGSRVEMEDADILLFDDGLKIFLSHDDLATSLAPLLASRRQGDFTQDAQNLNSLDQKEEVPCRNLVFGASRYGDGSETDPDGIPTRFLRMHKGNRQNARDAFIATLQWRKENKIDSILSRPHPKFDICKEIFPHYFPGRDAANNPIIVQKPGGLDMNRALMHNVTMDDLLFHYVYVLEYCWNILEPGPPDGVMTSVIDMKGVGFKQICFGDMREFIQRSVSVISENYPQRAYRTFVINAPQWFGGLYKILKPLLRESTREKIEILNAGRSQDDTLEQYLGKASLPGELRFVREPDCGNVPFDQEPKAGPDSKIEVELRKLVLSVLEDHGVEMEPPMSSH